MTSSASVRRKSSTVADEKVGDSLLGRGAAPVPSTPAVGTCGRDAGKAQADERDGDQAREHGEER
jgi:hypothetical protein